MAIAPLLNFNNETAIAIAREQWVSLFDSMGILKLDKGTA